MDIYYVKMTKTTTLNEWFESMHLARAKKNYLIDNNLCFVNSVPLKKDDQILKDEYLMIDLSCFHQNDVLPYDYKIDVLYEDDYLIVVEKPPGFIVHSDKTDAPNVTNMVKAYLEKKGENKIPYPAHRLDIDTTGCLVFCKDVITLAYLSFLFEERKVKKTYLALVSGKAKDKGEISLKIGKDRHQNGKMVISKSGKNALTKFERINYFKNLSLLKVNILGGRTHQIRVHLASINLPLVGDLLYGSKINAKRVMLHHLQISFLHPVTHQNITIESKIPKDMKKYEK